MLESGDVITGSSALALAVAVAAVLVQIVKAYKERETESSGPINDLATVNDSLVRSLNAERQENTRLRDRLATAERRNEELMAELAQVRREFDALNQHLAELEDRLKKENLERG